ncbi:hypothetical protein [Comamonas thiooxydans]|uniref:hypothetical protein n=1 Tax=Comamonas thiooxydans TaxID=363952 RepID=UPI001E61B2F8|nr:hypothetical protein [Comamonas thiooxydans]
MKSRPLPEKLRAQLLREGLRIAKAQGIPRLIGEDFRVLVRFDEAVSKVHFSFRAPDDLSQDKPAEHWIQLR